MAENPALALGALRVIGPLATFPSSFLFYVLLYAPVVVTSTLFLHVCGFLCLL